jgi:signal transduction histidine kinase/ActR/RegA family two-component response regulator
LVAVYLFHLLAVAEGERIDGENALSIVTFTDSIEIAKTEMAGAPLTALQHAQEAERLAHDAAEPHALETALWLQGEALTRLNRPDEAQPVIERAIAQLSDESSKLAGDLLLARGRIERVLSEEGKALESFQAAYKVFEPLGEARSQALALQSIGTLYDSARQYERVIEYYQRASGVFSDGAILDLVSLNNRANAYRELEHYDEARVMLTEALAMAEASGSALLQARILTNLAVLEARSGNFDAAEDAAKRGFEQAAHDQAKGWAPFVWGARAELEMARGRTDAALAAIERAFEGADLENTPAPFRDFHETAYRAFKKAGDSPKALAHLAAFKRLDDQGRSVAASANLALMNAEFEFANKELQIQTLRADQLEKDAALATSKERQRRIIFLALLSLGIGLVAFLGFAYRSARKAERVATAFNEELEQKNTQLGETNIALQKANQAKLEFLAVTSHEIRTPLNAIIGFSDVVLAGERVQPQDREYLEMVHSAGTNLLSIVNDILDVSKLESGRLIVERAPMDVGGCILNVAEIWRKAAEDKGLDFNVDVCEGRDYFICDGRLIRQVVSNLLSNAVKFTNAGGVSVRFRPADDGGFHIEVTDTGVGIAPEKRDEIFETFKQADGHLQRDYGGTGLGLAIVRKIAEELGGSVALQSEKGFGSTFAVLIPAEKATLDQSADYRERDTDAHDRAVGTQIEFGELNVLIVENNATNAALMRAFLQHDVQSIEVVENGALAVDAVEAGSFDIVLMDKQMPVMDGVEATRAIRSLLGPARNIPIVAVTAEAFDDTRKQVLESGMDGFVSKPLDAATLKDAIATTLESRSRRAA